MNAYRRMLGKMASALLLAGAFVVVSAARADAALIVYICDDDQCLGAGSTQIVDNGAGDTNPIVGRINAQLIGGTIDVLATSSKVGLSSLSLNYDIERATFTAIGQPYFFAADDNFTNLGLATMEADASDGGGVADLFIGPGTFNPNLAGVPNASCVMDCTTSAPVLATPNYLAIRIAPTLGATGARGDATVIVPQQSVPDGGSTVLLLGSALCAFGVLRRRIGL